jgi:hypothetical protein
METPGRLEGMLHLGVRAASAQALSMDTGMADRPRAIRPGAAPAWAAEQRMAEVAQAMAAGAGITNRSFIMFMASNKSSNWRTEICGETS